MTISNKEIEELELKYLEKIHSALNANLENIIENLKSMNKLIDHWKEKIKITKSGNTNNKEDGFDVGAERVIYSVLQRASDLGEPNSSPVAADLFFENREAFVNIDLKTCQEKSNLADHWAHSISVNQTSYRSKMNVKNSKKSERPYEPALEKYYLGKPNLTYFVTILYSFNKIYSIANINVAAMPNGQLVEVYGKDPLRPGKNLSQARFAQENCYKFKLLDNKKRIKILYENLSCLDNNSVKKLEDNLLSLIRVS